MADQFGQTAAGVPVQAIMLSAGELTVRLLTLGSILHSVRLDGVGHDLTRASPSVTESERTMPYHGAIVGPVANRLGGAMAVVDGMTHRLVANEGANILHSGAAGTHARVWTIEAATGSGAQLAVDLTEALDGLPGKRRLTARWQVSPPASLNLTLTATTDAPTLMNPANHSYWNLDGTPLWQGHSLRIAADRWLPVDDAQLPQGPPLPVAGTAMDFRTARTPRPGDPALDHNFCLADATRELTDVLWLTGQSGVTMTIATTAPGLQVYDGRAARRPDGRFHEAMAFEPQFWPDAPRNPAFPPILLRPGDIWQQRTQWRFAAG